MLNNRTMLETIFNVKYIITENEISRLRPYGYGKLIDSDTDFSHNKYFIYQNEYFLPFGYTYSYYIPVEIYKSLNAIQKQQALMQGVVINEKLPLGFNLLGNIKLNGITAGRIKKANRDFSVESGEKILLSFNAIANSETYIRFQNINYLSDDISTASIYMKYYSDISFNFRVSRNPNNSIANLGFSEGERKDINIFFDSAGKYSFDSIEIIFLPMGEEYIKQVEALKEDHLENVEEFTNGIRGTANLKSNKIMVFSIPYSKGWTAYVNGKKTKLLIANTMFMALPLKAGFYDIELKYLTPGLKLGMILSFLGFLLFAGICRLERKRTN
jgi:uncharacterized membrane protein YfhO